MALTARCWMECGSYGPTAVRWPLFSTCPSPPGRLAPCSTWVFQNLPLSVAVDQQIKAKQKPPYAFSGEMGGGHPADPFFECECSGGDSVTAGMCVLTFLHWLHYGLKLRLQGGVLLAVHVCVLTSAGPKDMGVLKHGHRSPAWCGSSEPRTSDKSVPHCLTNWLPSCFALWCLRLMLAFSLIVQARMCPCSKRRRFCGF